MLGYLDKEAGSIKSSDRGSFFPTGDIGFMSSDGYIYITSRKKDLIIKGGVNISPSSIENVILQEPFIEEVSVVGVPHEIYGEEIVAVIKLRQGYEFEKLKKNLIEVCKVKLSQIQQPSLFFE